MVFSEIDLDSLRYYYRSLAPFVPSDVYDHTIIGHKHFAALLNGQVLTEDLVPMLKDFYKEFLSDTQYVRQRETIINELEQYENLTFELCEKLGYQHFEEFYPCFTNDANPHPFLIKEEGITTDCTGITLHAFPPEEATFAMLYTLEKELQEKLSTHPLAKALKVCIR